MQAHQLAVGVAGLVAAAYWPHSPPPPASPAPVCTCQCDCGPVVSWYWTFVVGAGGCVAGIALGAAGAGAILRYLLAAVGLPVGGAAPTAPAEAPAGAYRGSHDGAESVRARARALGALPWARL